MKISRIDVFQLDRRSRNPGQFPTGPTRCGESSASPEHD